MSARAALRTWLLLCVLGVTGCEGTETGNPDLSTGGGGGYRASDGGGGPGDAGVAPSFDSGRPPPRLDAGWVPGQDGGIGADADGGVPDAPDDDLDAGAR